MSFRAALELDLFLSMYTMAAIHNALINWIFLQFSSIFHL